MSDITLWQLLLKVAEVKKKGEKIDGFIKKLMIPESEIEECPKFEVKSKIGNILVNKKILKNVVSEFTKLILFLRVWKNKNKNWQK